MSVEIGNFVTFFSTSKHADICNKIRQLYRKQEFQFKGVYG
jgi:hypothetical protein